LTNSKRPSAFVRGVYPTHLERGQGCYVWDTDGNKLLDYIGSLGANTLGYCNPIVDNAIRTQLSKGITHSLPTALEVEVAEKVKKIYPFIEKLRFFKNGSDACSASVRIARAYRDKMPICSTGYHGVGDLFVSLTKPAFGVDHLENIEEKESVNKFTAAVIIEPVTLDVSDKRKDELRVLRKDCNDTGSVLIFDEIITGGRFPKMCLSSYWDIYPDLICMGKGLANGMPISIVGGSAKIMDAQEWFYSGTFFGETLSLAAMSATLDELSRRDMTLLWECGQRFIDKFNALDDQVKLVGYPTRCTWSGDLLKRSLLWQEAVKVGILFGRAWFFNWELIQHTDFTIEVCREIFDRINRNEVKLEGEIPKESFKR
jgi:glutamate-1-semialdehyde 2,1-aminomutase